MNTANLQVTTETKRNGTLGSANDAANEFLKSVFKCQDDFRKPVLKDVTPGIARLLLERNTKNRGLRRKHIMWLAKQMELGYWLFTGDCIRFSVDGFLCDKQHTLAAIVESNTTQKFIILCGLDNRIIDVLDTGVSRTAGDVLKMNGVSNWNTVAAICKKVLLFKVNRKAQISSRSSQTKESFSNDELIINMKILEEVTGNDAYSQAAAQSVKYYEMFRAITTSQYGAYHFLFSEKSPDDAWEFLSKFSSGAGLESDSPIYLLRKRIEQEALSKIRYEAGLKTFWFITAWNKFRRGEKLKVLQTPQSIVIPEII